MFCILHPQEILNKSILVLSTVRMEIFPDLLINTLNLAARLRVVSRSHANCYPNFSMNTDQTWRMNCGPQSLTMSSGIKIWWNKVSATLMQRLVVSVLCLGKILPYFFPNKIKSVIKSMVMCDHGCCGIGSGINLPTRKWRGTFAWAHMLQELTWSFTSWDMLCHQYFPWIKASVRKVPGWPEAGLEWALLISRGGTYMRSGGHSFGMWQGRVF